MIRKSFGLLAILVIAFVLAGCGSSARPNSDPDAVATEYVQSLRVFNFGKACSHVAKSLNGKSRECALSYTANTGFALSFIGVDPFAGIELLVGEDGELSKKVKPNGDLVYTVIDCTAVIGQAELTLTKNAQGEWVIVSIEGVESGQGSSGERAPQCKAEGP